MLLSSDSKVPGSIADFIYKFKSVNSFGSPIYLL